jgi:hypothetical protein
MALEPDERTHRGGRRRAVVSPVAAVLCSSSLDRLECNWISR